MILINDSKSVSIWKAICLRSQERTNQVFVQITDYINITSLPRKAKPARPWFNMAVHNSKGRGAATMLESKEVEGFI